MRERVDRERVVPEQHSAQAEAPHKQVPSADQPKRGAKGDRRHQVVLVQPAQLRKLREVADVFEARVVVFIGDDPANLRPEKAKQRRRMQIEFLVRMSWMEG